MQRHLFSIYDIEENTLKDNIKVSVYGSNEKMSTTENYFECKKEVTSIDGITKYYYVVLEFLNKEENQNEYQNKVLKGSMSVELSTETVPYQESILNGMDPVLKDGLIPVTIEDDGTVHQAHLGEEWYSYEKKECLI